MKKILLIIHILVLITSTKVVAQISNKTDSSESLFQTLKEDTSLLKNRLSEFLDCYCLQTFVNNELKYKKSKKKVNFCFYNYISSSLFLNIPYEVFDSIANNYVIENFENHLKYYPDEYSSNYFSICKYADKKLKEKYLSMLVYFIGIKRE
jgi:hypothetical protein